MKLFSAVMGAVLTGVVVSGLSAEPTFHGAPGFISLPGYTRAGDAGNYVSGIQSFDYDHAGNLYVFEENRFIVKNPHWSPQTLYDYGPFNFGSFLAVFGDKVYCGESMNYNTVITIPTAGGEAFTLFTLANNYDCAFDSQSRVFISANPNWVNNEIYVWWNGLTEPKLLASMGKYSGPLAFDRDENLYYGFSGYPAGPEDVVYFTQSQVGHAISTGSVLTSDDWTVYASGVDAPAGMVFDRNTPSEQLFSSSTTGKVTRIYGKDSYDSWGSGDFPSFLRFSGGIRNFMPFSAAGGQLSILCTDWVDCRSTIFLVKPCCQNFILGAGDYGEEGRSGIAIFRPATGLWAVRDLTRIHFGSEGDLPVSADYDGDGLSRPALFRPASGRWIISPTSRVFYGKEDDIPVPRDYNGNGVDEIALFRPASGLWAVKNITRASWGREGDFPLPADYGGQGKAVIAVFRPQDGLWAIRNLSRFYFGKPGDLPVPGDYNGDGSEEAAVFRPANNLWAVRSVTRFYLGSPGDWPIPIDLEGEGTAEAAVFRPSSAFWAVRGVTRVKFGAPEDCPASR